VLLAEHAWLVLASSSLALAIGCGLGILVTRRRGREFLPVVDGLAAIGQTVPPVAVLALAVPLAGFGTRPTLAALVLYGVLPVVRATVSGIESVPRAVREAAVGMGMTDFQTLLGVELRLAWPVILAGVRTSVVINVGTATIGATVGAGGLGAPIIAGITAGNPAWVLEGAALAGLLAVLADAALGRLGGGRSSG
jgi:osmoprotectant transport system permease protein